MSWGTELWDQYDLIGNHTQKGIEFCEKYTHFVKERCAIELDYAAKLKKLVKNYQPKKKEEEDYQFTWAKGFRGMMNELHDIAGQHEIIAENLTSAVFKECQNLILEMKQEKKRCLQEGFKIQQHLSKTLDTLEKSKRQYEKTFRESERASETHKRADADINLSRAEVEKTKAVAQLRTQECDKNKNDYAATLQETNRAQNEHYTSLMPAVFQQLQEMDERRILQLQNFIRESAKIENGVIPIIKTCIEGMENAANSINVSEDSKMVVDRYKSGFEIPQDIPFDDLSSPNSSVGSGSDSSLNTPKYSGTVNSRTSSGTITGRSKKRTGLFGIFSASKQQGGKTEDTKEDYSNLAPNQQKKQLQKKITKLKHDIAKETAERDGMSKMRDVYLKNPALGDASSLDKKMEENGQTLDELNQELQKYESFLANAEGRLTPNMARKRSSMSHEENSVNSMTMSASDLTVTDGNRMSSSPLPANNVQTPPSTEEQNSDTPVIESEIPTPDISVTSPEGTRSNSSYQEQASFDDVDEEYDDSGILGTARAKFPFEATASESVTVEQDEELYIVDRDHDDGWTRVRKLNGDEGFIPTTYAHCHFYGEHCVDCGENVPAM